MISKKIYLALPTVIDLSNRNNNIVLCFRLESIVIR